MMKKMIALLMVLSMLIGCCAVMADEVESDFGGIESNEDSEDDYFEEFIEVETEAVETPREELPTHPLEEETNADESDAQVKTPETLLAILQGEKEGDVVIYAAPSEDSEILSTVRSDALAYEIDMAEGWYHIRLSEGEEKTEGYVLCVIPDEQQEQSGTEQGSASGKKQSEPSGNTENTENAEGEKKPADETEEDEEVSLPYLVDPNGEDTEEQPVEEKSVMSDEKTPEENNESGEAADTPEENKESAEAADTPEENNESAEGTDTPEENNESGEAAEVATAKADAPVRLMASGMSEIVITLEEGTELNVLGREGSWLLVEIEVDGELRQLYIYENDVNLPEAEQQTEQTEQQPDAPAAVPSVEIFTSAKTVMQPGETVYLTSLVKNGEGYELRYRWQCDKGSGFEYVDDGNEPVYAFPASVETLSWSWRLELLYRPAK